MTPYYDHDGVTIYHGDSFDLLHELSGIDAVVTDPPYSSGGAFRGDRAQQTSTKYVDSGAQRYMPEFAGDNRDQRSFLAWATLWLNAARNASRPGAMLCSFIDWRQLPILSDAIQAGGWTWRGTSVWSKGYGRPRNGGFSSAAEYVVWATHGPMEQTDLYAPGVFECSTPSDKVHIAQKPADVMRWVLSIIPPGSTVLDPFMGSGSTLEAARDLGHKAIGIEVDERYCEVAAERLSQQVLDFGGVA